MTCPPPVASVHWSVWTGCWLTLKRLKVSETLVSRMRLRWGLSMAKSLNSITSGRDTKAAPLKVRVPTVCHTRANAPPPTCSAVS